MKKALKIRAQPSQLCGIGALPRGGLRDPVEALTTGGHGAFHLPFSPRPILGMVWLTEIESVTLRCFFIPV